AATVISLNLNQPLPFVDGTFSHIVAHNVLEHVDDLIFSITELDRVLARGGVLQIEVPHIGSYNHGTDVTHKRGLTFDSFNFLLNERSYLYPQGGGPFRYRLVGFNRENWIDGHLVREQLTYVPKLGSYPEWINAMRNFEIPGTFGFVMQKV
ncbi:MAG: methyltransferase domain-containing protein, partial [Pseudohongiellaceae bacterium]